MKEKELKIVYVVPTGIGASIGGYAGDAGIAARYLSSVCDLVLTHPNVLNAAMFNEALPNTLYIEGHFLDAFFQKERGFKRVHAQKIGVVIDRTCRPYEAMIKNAVHATMVSTGCQVMGYRWTDHPLDISFAPSEYGYAGQAQGIEQLINSAKELQAQGATAVALLTFMDVLEEGEDSQYLQGIGVDPIGGLEASISHAVAQALDMPVAHSPVFKPHMVLNELDPRVAAEEIGLTYLPCILKGLHRAPEIVPYAASDIQLEDIDALVTPWDCLGGTPMLRAYETGIPIIAIKDNQTILELTADKMGFESDRIWECANHLEAAGLLLAMKAGIAPEVLRSPFENRFVER